ncbi:MAG: S8 family peptidase, partial [Candidatus Micrarchaeota archaeon]
MKKSLFLVSIAFFVFFLAPSFCFALESTQTVPFAVDSIDHVVQAGIQADSPPKKFPVKDKPRSFTKAGEFTVDFELAKTLAQAGIVFNAKDAEDYAETEEIPLLVELDNEVAPAQAVGTAVVSRSSTAASAVSSAGGSLKYKYHLLPLLSVSVKRGQLVFFSASIRQLLNVKSIEVDSQVEAFLDESVPMIFPPEVKQQLEAKYGKKIDGSGVKIAILDTGIKKNNQDLDDLDDNPATSDPKVILEHDFTSGDSDATDGNGHGTHVASTAAGTGQASNYQFVGVAPKAQLLIGKVLNDYGFGYDSGIIAGIEWAVDNGADVISMSLGGDGDQPDLNSAVEKAVSEGVVVTVAAGNDGSDYYTIGSPARAPSAITVGAINKDNKLAAFSSRGPVQGVFAVKPEIVAPGVSICAARVQGGSIEQEIVDYGGVGYFVSNYLAPCGSTDYETAKYWAISGTSMATPHVAGAAALVLQIHPDWTPSRVKSALVQTATPLPKGTGDPSDVFYNVFEQGGGEASIGPAISARFEVSPAAISGGVQGPSTKEFKPDFVIGNWAKGVYGFKIVSSKFKNIETGEKFDVANSFSTVCVHGQNYGKPQGSVDVSSLPLGVYSAYFSIDVYPDCDFSKQAEEKLVLPVGFAKVVSLKISVINAPAAPPSFTLFSCLNVDVRYSSDETVQLASDWDTKIYDAPLEPVARYVTHSTFDLDSRVIVEVEHRVVDSSGSKILSEDNTMSIYYFIDKIDFGPGEDSKEIIYDLSKAKQLVSDVGDILGPTKMVLSGGHSVLDASTLSNEKNIYMFNAFGFFLPELPSSFNIRFKNFVNPNPTSLFGDYSLDVTYNAREKTPLGEANVALLPTFYPYPFNNNDVIELSELEESTVFIEKTIPDTRALIGIGATTANLLPFYSTYELAKYPSSPFKFLHRNGCSACGYFVEAGEQRDSFPDDFVWVYSIVARLPNEKLPLDLHFFKKPLKLHLSKFTDEYREKIDECAYYDVCSYRRHLVLTDDSSFTYKVYNAEDGFHHLTYKDSNLFDSGMPYALSYGPYKTPYSFDSRLESTVLGQKPCISAELFYDGEVLNVNEESVGEWTGNECQFENAPLACAENIQVSTGYQPFYGAVVDFVDFSSGKQIFELADKPGTYASFKVATKDVYWDPDGSGPQPPQLVYPAGTIFVVDALGKPIVSTKKEVNFVCPDSGVIKKISAGFVDEIPLKLSETQTEITD